MTTHYNTSIAEDAARVLNTKGNDTLPSTMNILTPVIPITRCVNIVKSTSAINNTSANLYITPSDKDFYITSATLSVIKDATSTSVSSRINVNVDGINSSILRIDTLTLTAQTAQMSLNFTTPVKVDRGSTITISNSTNVANVSAGATITGYTVETTKGV